AQGAPGRRQRRDHRGRQGHAGAPGVQRGLRLRPGGDGQLGVLRQPDPGERQEARRRPAARQRRAAHPRRRPGVRLEAGLPGAGRVLRRPGRRGPAGRRPLPGGPEAGPRARLDGAVPRFHRPRPDRGGCPVTGTTLTPVLSAHWDREDLYTLDGYRAVGGYGALRKALAMEPDALVDLVKASGLRGRGGAGFPTGMKWGFLPKDNPNPRYLVVNADESEPGTCKDIPLMMANPHALVEGVIISAYAIRSNHAFIYVRGEVLHVIRRLRQAVAEAREAGLIGTDILGSGFDLDVVVHAGAGAYICGEETALLDSLEGYRGQPRLKPPFPAVAGLYA